MVTAPGKWQRTKWPGADSMNSGSSRRHRACAAGQRGWKAQPGGGPVEDQIPPGTDFLYDEKFKTVAPLESAIEKIDSTRLWTKYTWPPRSISLRIDRRMTSWSNFTTLV